MTFGLESTSFKAFVAFGTKLTSRLGVGMKVSCLMLVEDEFIVAADLSARLQKMGYQVLAPVSSGEQAIECLENGASPDLVVMDIHLNGPLDGIQTAEMIRERFELPVIFLTAFAENNVVQRARTTEPLWLCGKTL